MSCSQEPSFPIRANKWLQEEKVDRKDCASGRVCSLNYYLTAEGQTFHVQDKNYNFSCTTSYFPLKCSQSSKEWYYIRKGLLIYFPRIIVVLEKCALLSKPGSCGQLQWLWTLYRKIWPFPSSPPACTKDGCHSLTTLLRHFSCSFWHFIWAQR